MMRGKRRHGEHGDQQGFLCVFVQWNICNCEIPLAAGLRLDLYWCKYSLQRPYRPLTELKDFNEIVYLYTMIEEDRKGGSVEWKGNEDGSKRMWKFDPHS